MRGDAVNRVKRYTVYLGEQSSTAINLLAVAKHMAKYVEGGTIVRSAGVWKGEAEYGYRAEILTSSQQELSCFMAWIEDYLRVHSQSVGMMTSEDTGLVEIHGSTTHDNNRGTRATADTVS